MNSLAGLVNWFGRISSLRYVWPHPLAGLLRRCIAVENPNAPVWTYLCPYHMHESAFPTQPAP
ncbi:hypothetical protein YC2023_100160 [Brassica napus]